MCAAQRAMTAMSLVKVMVIGAGRMGTLHAGKLAQIAGIERAAALSQRYGGRAVADWQLGALDVDAAVIAAPPELHAVMLQGCLERGLHVLVEKPVATSVDDAQAMIALAAHAQRVLQVGHVERFNAAFRAIASRI